MIVGIGATVTHRKLMIFGEGAEIDASL